MTRRLVILTAATVWASAAAIVAVHPATAAGGDERIATTEPAPPPRPLNVSPEQENELLSSLKEKRPEDYARLMKLRDENPREYRWALGVTWRAFQLYRNLPPEMQTVAEKAQQARVKAWQLGNELRGAKDDAEKTRLRAELVQTLQAEFDAEQQLREFRLAQLEEQLKRLAAEVKDRAQQRDSIIEENVNRLLDSKRPERPRLDRPLRPEGPPRGGHPASRPHEGAARHGGPASRPAE